MDKEKNPHEFAKKFLEKTGVQLIDLINQGMSNEDIKMEFFRAGLKRPGEEALNSYREMFKSGKLLAETISDNFRRFLATEVGLKEVTSVTILDSIIFAGFLALKNNPDVSVNETLKALELKDRYRNTTPEDIMEKVKGIFSGKTMSVAMEPKKKKAKKVVSEKLPEEKKEKPVKDDFNFG